ncbi:hypothetical protein CSUI_003870 [Cystoisospora suis]|uniref:Uncharacterized protein n=1 Tax=Cystoisospora suis TaxID=483139 RepID=A0A2C6L383_9APIC|nr:hypothetical protein CSUI_003870 [Cystoisospora suis]
MPFKLTLSARTAPVDQLWRRVGREKALAATSRTGHKKICWSSSSVYGSIWALKDFSSIFCNNKSNTFSDYVPCRDSSCMLTSFSLDSSLPRPSRTPPTYRLCFCINSCVRMPSLSSRSSNPDEQESAVTLRSVAEKRVSSCAVRGASNFLVLRVCDLCAQGRWSMPFSSSTAARHA